MAGVISIFLMCINQVKRNVMNQKRVYDESKHIECHFPKYRIKILLGHFNVKVGEEIICGFFLYGVNMILNFLRKV